MKQKRYNQILEILNVENLATIHDLSQRLGVSYMTIWRDLEYLEKSNLIKKVRGGAIANPLSSTLKQFADQYPSYNWFEPNISKKTKIGHYAAQHLVNDGDSITIEAGSTASSMAQFLTHSNLTVLTNGLLASTLIFPHIEKTSLMCSGGILIETGAFIGPQAEDFFSRYRVQTAFFSTQGVTPNSGFTDPTPLYTRLKNVMKENAENIVMLVDSTKLGVRSLVQVMTIDEVDILVTNCDAPKSIVNEFRERGLDVRLAS